MRATTPQSGTYEEMVGTIVGLIAPLRDLQRRNAAIYTPIVQRLIHSSSCNESEIEHTLDHLLDCACIPEGLALFRDLCRHYWKINPQATAEYVSAYLEMWDNEEAQSGGGGTS
jgi:hypothetical protein